MCPWECDLKTLFLAHLSPSCLSLYSCSLSLPPSCPPSILRLPEGGSLHALIGLTGSGSGMEDARVALDVVPDKDGPAHHIRQSSPLFLLIKKTTLDEKRSILQCHRYSCGIIHLLTVASRSHACPTWISVYLSHLKDTFARLLVIKSEESAVSKYFASSKSNILHFFKHL